MGWGTPPGRSSISGVAAPLVAAAAVIVLAVVSPAPAEAGVKHVDFRADTPAQGRFFNAGGLELRAQCAELTPDNPALDVWAGTTRDGAMIHLNKQGFGSRQYAEDDSFDAGDTIPLDSIGGTDDAIGQIVYAGPGGRVVTVDWAAETDDAYGEAKDCAFVGTARVTGPGTAGRVNYRADAGDSKTILEMGDLRLVGSCGGANGGQVAVGAGSARDNASVWVSAQGGYIPATAIKHEDLDSTVGYVFIGTESTRNSAGQLIYASRKAGSVVTVDWAAEDSEDEDPFGGAKDCAFVGTASKTAFRPSLGGLGLFPDCQVTEIGVASEKNHALVHINSQGLSDTFSYGEDDNFNSNQAPSSLGLFDDFLGVDPFFQIGQIVYSTPGGTHVSADFVSSQDAPLGGFTCAMLAGNEIARP